MNYPVSVSVQTGQGPLLAFDVYRQYHVEADSEQAQSIAVQMYVSLTIPFTLAEHVHVNPRPITRRRIVSFIQTYSKECT